MNLIDCNGGAVKLERVFHSGIGAVMSNKYRMPGVVARAGALLVAMTMLAGCQHGLRVENMPRMRWLVMPLSQTDSATTVTNELRGWWLGARTIRRNSSGGQLLANDISARLVAYPAINQFSPIDLSYYFADKRKKLSTAYPNLKAADMDRLLSKVPAIDYARELGADKLVRGRIERLWIGENRTIHWWWAVLEADVEIVNVRTKQVEWSRHYSIWRNFGSTEDAMAELAQKLIKQLEKEYLRPMTAGKS